MPNDTDDCGIAMDWASTHGFIILVADVTSLIRMINSN